MQPELKAEICPKCKGRGVFSTGTRCDNCRGVGAIGTDGQNEYYLQMDAQGNLRVADIKSSKTSPSPFPEQPSPENAPKPATKHNFMFLFLLVLLILYAGFVGIHIFILKNLKLFWIVTVITGGFMFLLVAYNTQLLKLLVSRISKMIVQEPDDYLTSIKKNKKK